MEDYFENLKKNLDETVFNNIRYNREESINKVLNNEGFKSKPSVNKIKLKATGILGFVVCILLLIYTFQMVELNNEKSPKVKSRNLTQQEIHKKTAQSDQQYIPIKDPGPLSKEELEFRMMNTVDYFSTAQGSFTYTQTGNTITVNYGIVMNDDKYDSFTEVINGENPDDTIIEYNNGHQSIRIYPKKKEYNIIKMAGPYKKGGPIKISDVVGTTGSGQGPAFSSRPRPNTAAFLSLFHWELVQSFLIANPNWKITNQNDEMFGYKTVLVEGSIHRGKYSKEKGKIYIASFKMWVNRPTGIILKWESYDSKGNVVDSLNTTNLKLNTHINDDLFKAKIPSDYKKTNGQ